MARQNKMTPDALRALAGVVLRAHGKSVPAERLDNLSTIGQLIILLCRVWDTRR